MDRLEKNTQDQITRLINPLISKYCQESCQVMGIKVNFDQEKAIELSPGFDEHLETKPQEELVAVSAQITLFFDEQLDNSLREKILDLLQQHLDVLDYPVQIITKLTRNPLPADAKQREPELKQKIIDRFQAALENLTQQYCPQSCLVTDISLQTELSKQMGNPNEYVKDGSSILRIKEIVATILFDDKIPSTTQATILELARAKVSFFDHVKINSRSFEFPKPWEKVSSQKNLKESIENNEREENKDEKKLNVNLPKEWLKADINLTQAAQAQNPIPTTNPSNKLFDSEAFTRQNLLSQEEIKKEIELKLDQAMDDEYNRFLLFGVSFTCGIIILFLILFQLGRSKVSERTQEFFRSPKQEDVNDYPNPSTLQTTNPPTSPEKPLMASSRLSQKYEIDRLKEELLNTFVQSPKVSKIVFSRILRDESIETNSKYLAIFGEHIFLEVLKDPALQSDITQLLEYFSKNPVELQDTETLHLLKSLENQTTASKLIFFGNQYLSLFDFLVEMDPMQTLELIRSEPPLNQAVIFTQCDPQKRAKLYSFFSTEARVQLLTELSQIEYLPKTFIRSLSEALRKKIQSNPKLDTHSLPGSEVLITLLEKTGYLMQKTILSNLDRSNPESARNLKSKLVSLDTLRYLREGQLMEVVLNLKHKELIEFLRSLSSELQTIVLSRLPTNIQEELSEELELAVETPKETQQLLERKIINRIKSLSNSGQINLIEINERMFSEQTTPPAFVEATRAASVGLRNSL